jgi:hypothetical protein
VVTYAYNDLGQLDMMASPNQLYAHNFRFDSFGRMVQWNDAGGGSHRAAFAGYNMNHRLFSLVSQNGSGSTLMDLNYAQYDVAGNLRQLTEHTGSIPAGLKQTWAYGYDGLGRLKCAQHGGTGGTCSPPSGTGYSYDNLGNMTAYGALNFTPATVQPHRIASSSEKWGRWLRSLRCLIETQLPQPTSPRSAVFWLGRGGVRNERWNG